VGAEERKDPRRVESVGIEFNTDLHRQTQTYTDSHGRARTIGHMGLIAGRRSIGAGKLTGDDRGYL
jgi:hypothetical protein